MSHAAATYPEKLYTVTGYTQAVVHVGDLLKLRCISATTWVVHEIVPESDVVLLVPYNGEHNSSAGITITTPISKRTTKPIELMGAIVTRDILINVGPDSDGDTDSRLDSEDGYGLNSETIIFRLPIPIFDSVYSRMKSLVRRNMHRGAAPSSSLALQSLQQQSSRGRTKPSHGMDFPGNNPILAMQYEAHVRMWLARKEDMYRARRALKKIGGHVQKRIMNYEVDFHMNARLLILHRRSDTGVSTRCLDGRLSYPADYFAWIRRLARRFH